MRGLSRVQDYAEQGLHGLCLSGEDADRASPPIRYSILAMGPGVDS